MLLAAQPILANNWQISGGRALADPWLNAWASSQLPDAARVKIRIIPAAPSSGAASAPFTIRLADFNLSALDALALGDASDTPQLGELQLRALAVAAGNATIAAGSPAPALAYADPSFAVTDMTVPQFLVAARAVRDLVSHARALTPDDLALPSGQGRGLDPGARDRAELSGRLAACTAAAAKVEQILQGAADALRAAIADGATGPAALAATLRSAMLPAASFGVAGCVSRWPDATDLAPQSNALLARAEHCRRDPAVAVIQASRRGHRRDRQRRRCSLLDRAHGRISRWAARSRRRARGRLRRSRRIS